MADDNSSSFVTLLTPKLDPLALGFTKQGNPVLLIISEVPGTSLLFIKTESAMGIPYSLRYDLQACLLKVRAEQKELQLVYGISSMSR